MDGKNRYFWIFHVFDQSMVCAGLKMDDLLFFPYSSLDDEVQLAVLYLVTLLL